MNDITTTGRRPTFPREPALPPSVRGALDHIDGMIADGAPVTVRGPEDRTNALELIPAYELLCAPSNRAVIEAWLRPLVFSVRNPPEAEHFDGRLRSVIIGCAELPLGVWSEETMNLALRTFQYMPAGADVYALLSPVAERLQRTLRNLQRMATAETFVPARGVTSEQEKAYIQEAVRGRVAALPDVTDRDSDGTEPPSNVTPFPARAVLKDRAPPPVPSVSAQLQDVIRTARQRLMERPSDVALAALRGEG